jgi:hypothetical protein
MQKDSARSLQLAAIELGVDIGVDKKYSGRGMYGDTTYAVTVNGIASLASIVAMASRNFDDIGKFTFEDFVEDMQNLRGDSMGRGYVYY